MHKSRNKIEIYKLALNNVKTTVHVFLVVRAKTRMLLSRARWSSSGQTVLVREMTQGGGKGGNGDAKLFARLPCRSQ